MIEYSALLIRKIFYIVPNIYTYYSVSCSFVQCDLNYEIISSLRINYIVLMHDFTTNLFKLKCDQKTNNKHPIDR